MDEHQISSDVVVVGGGLAGLAAACYLARAGRQVTLVEQAEQVGGAASTRNHDGFLFNRGLHALYPGGAVSEVLRDLDISYSFGTPGSISALHKNMVRPFPDTVLALLRSPLLDARDKFEFARMFMMAPRYVPAAFASWSAEDWIAQVLKRPRSRALLAALARTWAYSSALDIVSAEVVISRLQQILRYPVQYVHGGWQTIVDSLRQVAERAGVRMLTGTRVETVVFENGCATGVRLRDGKVLPAAAVVLAIPPRDAVKLVEEADAPALHRAVRDLVPALAASLDVALHHLPNARHAVVQDLDQPRFLSAQSVYADVAPAGGAFIGTLKQLDPRCLSEPEADQRDLENILDAVQPGWREVLEQRVFLPHIVAAGALPLAHSGGFAGRPQPQIAGRANVYIAGDWVGAEGYLADASFASARQTAELIAQHPESYAHRDHHLAEAFHA